MPNVFKDLRGLQPLIPRHAYGMNDSSIAHLLRPMADIPIMADLADIEFWNQAYSATPLNIPIRPIAIANPFANQKHMPFDYPSGLVYVITQLRYNSASIPNPYGIYGVYSSSSVGQLWRYTPGASTGTASLTLTYNGATVYTVTINEADGVQTGVFWTTDAMFDDVTTPTAGTPDPLVTAATTGTGTWDRIAIGLPQGGLATDGPITGWDPVYDEQPRYGVLDAQTATDMGLANIGPQRAKGLWPKSLMENASRFGQVTIQNWSGRYGHALQSRPGTGFPTIFTNDAAYETYDAPEWVLPGSGKWVIPHPYGFTSGALDSFGAIYTLIDYYTGSPSPPGPGIEVFAEGTHGFDMLAMEIVNDVTNTAEIEIKEWETGTVLYSGTITSGSDGDFVPISFTPPAITPGQPWRVSCRVYCASGSVGDYVRMLLRYRPIYYPWPYAVPRADIQGVVVGGYNADSTRPVTVNTWWRAGEDDVVKAAGELTHSMATLVSDGPATITFFPAQGWYKATGMVSYGEFEMMVGIGAGEYSYGTTYAAMSKGHLPFRCTTTTSGTKTLTKLTPAPQAVTLGSATWLRLLSNAAAGLQEFATITADATGDFKIELVYATADPNTVSNRRGQTLEAWYSLTDPDVIEPATMICRPVPYLNYTALTTLNAPPTGAGLLVGVVGSAPTGAFEGHAGEVYHNLRGGAWTFMPPEDGTVTSAMHVAKDGGWPTDPVSVTIPMTTGQVATVRVRVVRHDDISSLTFGLPDHPGFGGIWIKAANITPT